MFYKTVYLIEGDIEMNKVSLPFNINPPLQCYLGQAYPLGIIFAQNEAKCYPWLFNYYYTFKYIKILNTDALMLEPNPQCNWFYSVDLFSFYEMRLPFCTIDKETIYTIVKNMMQQGYYCVGEFNEKYIPGYSSYKRHDFQHPFLIYEFDFYESVVSCAGYAQDGFYKEIKIKFHDFYSGLINTDKLCLNFVRLNEEFNYDCFDVEKFVVELNNYISSFIGNLEDKGLIAINQLKNYLLNLEKSGFDIDLRAIYVFHEHKFLMYKRLEYMLSKSLLKNVSSINSYNDIVIKSQKLKGMALKYNAIRNPDIIDRIVDQINEINNQESNILRQVLDEIGKNI